MFNWSVDETKFDIIEKPLRKIITFLRNQPEIKFINTPKINSYKEPLVIKVKLDSNTHSVRRVNIAFVLQEIVGNRRISVLEIK